MLLPIRSKTKQKQTFDKKSLLLSFLTLFAIQFHVSVAFAEAKVSLPTHVTIKIQQLKELSSTRLWHLLLHYETGIISGSRADGAAFFLSKEREPFPELIANIAAVFKKPTEPNTHFQCLFPARSEFILEKLEGFYDPKQLLKPECPKRDEFIADLDVQGLELLFASASARQSASMFGHTMIRVRRSSKHPPMEDPVVSFLAIDNADGLTEVFYGLTGQFHGVFEVANYAQQLLNYTVYERRHLWSVALNVPQEGLRRFANHLWEMNSTYFNYNFFNENCAFYNQTLLQMAIPDLDLLSSMGIFATPQEAIYDITRHPELVSHLGFSPSVESIYHAGDAQLTDHERLMVKQVVANPQPVSASPDRAAIIYKTALQLSMMQFSGGTLEQLREAQERYQPIAGLLQSVGPEPQLVQPDFSNPTLGTATHSLALTGGMLMLDSPFVDLELRPIIHERFEAPYSYISLNEIVLLKTKLRYQPTQQSLRLNQLVIGAIYTLRPWKLSSFPLSWSFDTGLRDASLFGRKGTDSYMELAWGLTLPLGQIGGFSILAGPVAEWTFGKDARAGGHAFANLTLYLLDRLTLNARGGTRYLSWDRLDFSEREDWAEGYLNLFIGRHLTSTLRARSRFDGSKLTGHELGLTLRYHWF